MNLFGKRALAFGATTAALSLLGAWVVGVLTEDPAIARSVGISAFIAIAVQVGAFFVVWPIVTKNAIAGWGVGSAIRFVAVIVYALVGEKVLGVDGGPALLSFVSFLFVSMLVEPLFLKR